MGRKNQAFGKEKITCFKQMQGSQETACSNKTALIIKRRNIFGLFDLSFTRQFKFKFEVVPNTFSYLFIVYKTLITQDLD